MSAYALDLDEVVILQDFNVIANGAEVTLILTNKNVIEVTRGFWGGDKDSNKYPLYALKEMNGKPNVRVGKSPNGKAQLELYFVGYNKVYSFKGLFVEKKWLSAIEKAYKAALKQAIAEEKREKRAANEGKGVGELIAPIMEKVGLAVIKNKESRILSAKCPKCGAEVSGSKGDQVTCSYCDAIFVIK